MTLVGVAFRMNGVAQPLVPSPNLTGHFLSSVLEHSTPIVKPSFRL